MIVTLQIPAATRPKIDRGGRIAPEAAPPPIARPGPTMTRRRGPRAGFDRSMAAVESKVGNDPDRVIAEIKRRLKI